MIDRIVASRYSSPLYTAVTSVIFGHSVLALWRCPSSRSNCATRVRSAVDAATGCASVGEAIVLFVGMAGCLLLTAVSWWMVNQTKPQRNTYLSLRIIQVGLSRVAGPSARPK